VAQLCYTCNTASDIALLSWACVIAKGAADDCFGGACAACPLERHMQIAVSDYIVSSKAAQTAIAGNNLGLPP
jgi:hypothetical protein